MPLNKEQIQRIKFLKTRIDKNFAQIQEYQEYEHLLSYAGFTNADIQKYLDKEHLTCYEELLRERKKYEEGRRNSDIETNVVAGLMGLGIAAILLNLFGEKIQSIPEPS